MSVGHSWESDRSDGTVCCLEAAASASVSAPHSGSPATPKHASASESSVSDQKCDGRRCGGDGGGGGAELMSPAAGAPLFAPQLSTW